MSDFDKIFVPRSEYLSEIEFIELGDLCHSNKERRFTDVISVLDYYRDKNNNRAITLISNTLEKIPFSYMPIDIWLQHAFEITDSNGE